MDLTVVALDHMVPDIGGSLGSQARLIVSQVGKTAVQPSARLTQATRVLQGPGVPEAWDGLARGHIPLSMAGVLPTGVTAVFELTDPERLQDPATGQSVHRGIILQLAKPSGDAAGHHLLASLTVRDMVPAGQADETVSAAAGLSKVAAFESEAALFDVPAAGDEAVLALFVPFRLRGTTMQTVAILVHVSPGKSDAAHRAAIARCQDEVAHSQADLGRLSHFELTAGINAVSVSTALALMEVPGQRRAALVYLASQTGAALSRDLMLTVDDALLERLAAAVKARVAAGTADRAAVGWEMEQAVLQAVAKMASRGALPPEVTAVFTSHYGQAGRDADSLEELSRRMASSAEFAASVVAENMICLEDDSPGARVRAFEWLQARDRAPAGYDPLAPARQRRAALDRAPAEPPAATPAGGQP